MPVTWKPPVVPGAAHFAYWDEAVFGYVTSTAFPDGRWRVCLFLNGQDDGSGISEYVTSEAAARKFVERWAEHNHARIAPAKGRHRLPHEGGK